MQQRIVIFQDTSTQLSQRPLKKEALAEPKLFHCDCYLKNHKTIKFGDCESSKGRGAGARRATEVFNPKVFGN